MPSPRFDRSRKHSNHLALLTRMMSDGVARKLERVRSLRSAYELLLTYPGLGPFLAFQYAIDLNYSSLLDFEEGEYVVAGPGALDGISKCFINGHALDPGTVIMAMVDQQEVEFARLGLSFEGLFGRPMQPIDCQNIFCEISKYARVAHPEMAGASGRTRIKQRYREDRATTVLAPMFPPKWKLRDKAPKILPMMNGEKQFRLF